MVPWYNVLLNSTLSTTRYLTDHYANVEFRVTGQEERDGHIYRVSEFFLGDRMIVHSTVDIPVPDNPAEVCRYHARAGHPDRRRSPG